MHTLLLADDSVTIQRVIELTFADEDIEVIAVSDGDQAIDRLESAPPDIVLADIGMPGRDGYEVARYVRQSAKLAHIPVVLLTGAFEPVDQAKAAEVDCDGVLAKPFEPQLVIGRVKELLASTARKSRPPADGKPAAPAAPALSAAVALGAAPAPPPPPLAQEAAPTDLDDYFDRLDDAFATVPGGPPAKAAAAEPPLSTSPGMSVADQIDWYASQQSPAADADIANAPDQTPDMPLSFELPKPSVTAAPPQATVAQPVVAPPPPVAAAPKLDPIVTAPGPARVVPPAAVVAPAAVVPPTAVVPPVPVSPPAPVVVAAAPVGAPAVAVVPQVSPAPPVVAPAPAAPVPAPVAVVPAPLPVPVPAVPRAVPSIAEAFAVILAAEQNQLVPAARPVWPTSQTSPAPPNVDLSDSVLEQITHRVLARLSDQVVRDTVTGIAERLVREEIERIKRSIG